MRRSTLGRFLLSLAVLAFAALHLVYAIRGTGLGPPWTPEGHILAGISGILLLIAAIALLTGNQIYIGSLLLAIMPLLRGLLVDIPHIIATPRNPGPWTSGFELFAIAGAALILADVASTPVSMRPGPLFHTGRLLFVAALVVFGVQHLLYARFIATLVTAWIPSHLFWAYFVGVAFLASALAILTGRRASLAATLLGTMFLLWVFLLHAPRVAAALHDSNERTSLLIALAMSGCSFAIANSVEQRVP